MRVRSTLALCFARTWRNTGVAYQIYLGFANIGDAGCVVLAQGLRARCVSLKLLALHGNHIGDVGVKAMATMLASSQYLGTALTGQPLKI